MSAESIMGLTSTLISSPPVLKVNISAQIEINKKRTWEKKEENESLGFLLFSGHEDTRRFSFSWKPRTLVRRKLRGLAWWPQLAGKKRDPPPPAGRAGATRRAGSAPTAGAGSPPGPPWSPSACLLQPAHVSKDAKPHTHLRDLQPDAGCLSPPLTGQSGEIPPSQRHKKHVY